MKMTKEEIRKLEKMVLERAFEVNDATPENEPEKLKDLRSACIIYDYLVGRNEVGA